MKTDLAWPDEEQLERNRLAIIEDSKSRIAELEAETGMSTREMLELRWAGKIPESEAIAEWFVVLDALRLMGQGEQKQQR